MRARNHSLLAAVDSVLLVSGTARFTGPREVVVSGLDDRIRITADTVCINTGSRSALPAVPGARLGGRIHDSESIQHVSPLPRRLTVIGGGYVGLEFACSTSPISIFPGGSCHANVTRLPRERSHSNSPGRVTTIP